MQSIEDIACQQRRARISNRELCETAGVHVQTYRRLRRGIHSPTLRTLEKLSDALSSLREAAQ